MMGMGQIDSLLGERVVCCRCAGVHVAACIEGGRVGSDPLELDVACKERFGVLVAGVKGEGALQSIDAFHFGSVFAGGIAEVLKVQSALDGPLLPAADIRRACWRRWLG